MKLEGFLAAALLLSLAGATDSVATKKERPPLTPTERCAKSILWAKEQVLRKEGLLLGRCVRAIAENAPTAQRRFRCSRMSRTGVGADRVERIARERLLAQCQLATMPDWLPPVCPAKGSLLGRDLSSREHVADCVISGGRCLALASVAQSIDGAIGRLSEIEPGVLDFALGGLVDQTLRACLEPFTTTTTMPAASTTTTLVGEPTTTTLIAQPTTTTTLPAEPTTTTTIPSQPTTTTTSTTVPEPEAPSIVITEIMSNPDAQSDSTGEYFEVLNTGTAAVDMQGWTVRDEGSNAFTIQDSVVLAAGRFAILARSQTAAGGSAAYVYGSAMSLANSADQIIIERDGELVDAVAYDASFPLAAGASMELAASATDVAANDSPANWCEAQSQMADGDRGSPGAAGPGCAGIQ